MSLPAFHKLTLLAAILLTILSYSCSKGGVDEPSAEYKITVVDKADMLGAWSAVTEIDSMAVVFTENNMNEYVYQKDTNVIVDRKEYSWYNLVKYDYKNRRVEYWIIRPDLHTGLNSGVEYQLIDDLLFIDGIWYSRVTGS